jgi:hypothetical protein
MPTSIPDRRYAEVFWCRCGTPRCDECAPGASPLMTWKIRNLVASTLQRDARRRCYEAARRRSLGGLLSAQPKSNQISTVSLEQQWRQSTKRVENGEALEWHSRSLSRFSIMAKT